MSTDRIIVSTVGKSLLLNLRNNRNPDALPAGIDLAEINELVKQSDQGEAAIDTLYDYLEKLTPNFSDANNRLIPAEISSLTAIGITNIDTLYFLAGISNAPVADEGEICAKVLARYYQKRHGNRRVKFKEVKGMVVKGGKLDKPEEMLHQLDNLVDELQRTETAPIILNLTGGYRLTGIYAAMVGFVHGCEIYYLHEEMRTPVGLPAIKSEILQLPLTLSKAEYDHLEPDKKAYYKDANQGSYKRFGLLDIVNRFPKTIHP